MKEVIGDCTLYLGDCLDIIPTLEKVDAVVTDPPYGINYKSTHEHSIDYGFIRNDNQSFDPSHLLQFKECIIWGGNNFTTKLPIGGWIVWDKRCSENADRLLGSPFELAWCNNKKLYKMVRVLHGGAKNADSHNGDVSGQARYHPTQKPVKVMQFCLNYIKSEVILDPYMGSGSTGLACIKEKRKFIGIELDEKYFDIACRRIEEAYRQPDMFIESPKFIQDKLI